MFRPWYGTAACSNLRRVDLTALRAVDVSSSFQEVDLSPPLVNLVGHGGGSLGVDRPIGIVEVLPAVNLEWVFCKGGGPPSAIHVSV